MKIELYERANGDIGIYLTGDVGVPRAPDNFRLRTQPIRGNVYDVILPLDAEDRADVQALLDELAFPHSVESPSRRGR